MATETAATHLQQRAPLPTVENSCWFSEQQLTINNLAAAVSSSILLGTALTIHT